MSIQRVASWTTGTSAITLYSSEYSDTSQTLLVWCRTPQFEPRTTVSACELSSIQPPGNFCGARGMVLECSQQQGLETMQLIRHGLFVRHLYHVTNVLSKVKNKEGTCQTLLLALVFPQPKQLPASQCGSSILLVYSSVCLAEANCETIHFIAAMSSARLWSSDNFRFLSFLLFPALCLHSSITLS